VAVLKDARREKFVQNLIKGMSQRQAYLDVYPASKKWKPESVDTKASHLAQEVEVKARFDELKAASADDAILTRKQRMVILSQLADDAVQQGKTRIQAIDVLNKMDGEYVKKIEATVSAPVKETAAAVAAILNE